MTRLLQAMAGARHGGAEAFFERLAIALHRTGMEQRLLIRREPGRAERLRAAGIEVIELPFGGIFDLATKPGFRRAIAAWQPQIVLSWMSRATEACPRGEFVHVARLGGYYDLKHYRFCDHLIGNTRALAAHFASQGWPRERVHYLPNFASFAPAPPVARASLATPAAAPLVLALGRLHPNKGFDVLLVAVAKLPALHLWLAGEGDLDAALRQQASALGIADRVHFLGWRDDVPALLAAADMLVCPSRSEPLGNTIIEAWAARLPVVAAAAAGPSELITDEETGLLVPVDDADALAAAMARLACDSFLRARLAAAGHDAFAAQFSETRVVAAYREFFASVLR